MTGEDLGERALARAIRAHDRVHLAGVDGEVDAREDLPSLDRGVEVLDLQQRMLAQPTLPSRLMPSNRCASTANSIGSSLKTSLQDRKSTRLNSSHTVISYAVFCLKKKNRN